MKEIKLQVEDYVYEFYRNIGKCAGGKSVEQVMTDALLRLAGEMSMNAINEKEKQKKKWKTPHTFMTRLRADGGRFTNLFLC